MVSIERSTARARAALAGRTLLFIALFAMGAFAIVDAGFVRMTEAASSASVVGTLTSSDTYVRPHSSSFYWLMGTSDARGLHITPECSVAYVVGPLLILCGLLSLLRRLPVRRMVGAAIAGVAVIASVNLLRISMVAVAVTHFPSDRAMWWWHVVVGSIVSLVGVGSGLALTTRVAFGGDRRASRRPATDGLP